MQISAPIGIGVYEFGLIQKNIKTKTIKLVISISINMTVFYFKTMRGESVSEGIVQK